MHPCITKELAKLLKKLKEAREIIGRSSSPDQAVEIRSTTSLLCLTAQPTGSVSLLVSLHKRFLYIIG
jgi:hypothetical protein